MEKVIRNGKVAVLYSPGYGAGWYSWNSNKELLFHPKLVGMVEDLNGDLIDADWVKENLGIENVYCGGASDLRICWLLEGTAFMISEYDGSESVDTLDELTLIA